MDSLIAKLRRTLGRLLWPTVTVLTLILIVIPEPVQSQDVLLGGPGNAPIVVDGTVIFEVRDTGGLLATERADQINRKIAKELRSPRLAEIFVSQKESLVYLQSRHTEEILTTVTEADVSLSQRKAFDQGRLWANQLQAALRQGQLQRRPQYLRQATFYSILVIGGATAIHALLHVLGRFCSRRWSRWLENQSHPLLEWERSLRLFWQLGLLGIQIGLWGTVAYYVTDIFPQARSWRYQFSTARVLDLGSRNYSVLDLLFFLASAIALWLLVGLVTRLFRLYVLNQTGMEQRVQDILGVLVQYSLTFVGGVLLLQIWGIDMSSLTILASVLGVGLGFGVQNITNNFISGFIITLERPIQSGDFINVGELVGTVERIGARSTEIRTLDQVTIIVPNSRFLENEVINWSHGDPVSRIHLPVGVAYGSNIERVKAALLEAVRRHPEVLLRPKPEVWFQGFGDSALNFDLLVWTGEPRKQFKIKSDLYYQVEASLRRHDISVPFPQRDLHLKSPQLDDLINALRYRFGDPHHNGHVHESVSPDSNAQRSLTPLPSAQRLENVSSAERQATATPPSFNRPSSLEFLANLDFDRLADMMRKEQGVPVGDRYYRFNQYPLCFTGTDAVEWLVQQQGYTREEALLIGQGLLQQGLIKSVMDDPIFKDGYYFYRFYRDEQSLSRQEHRNPSSEEHVSTHKPTDETTAPHDPP